MPLTDAEKSMCWHAARGLETGLTVDDVNTVLAKIGQLGADLQAERDRLAALEAAISAALHDLEHRDELSAIDRLRALVGDGEG